MERLSEEQREELKHELLGTCQSVDAVLERLGYDVSLETAEDQLLDGANSVERCLVCEWWFNSCDLEEDHEGVFKCEQCME